MECATHAGVEAVPCKGCANGVCAACATWDVDGQPACETCGRAAEERSQALGSALLAFTGVGYLAVLAIGVLIWKARPFIGGLAAIAAIALGRGLQLLVKPSVAVRRISPRA